MESSKPGSSECREEKTRLFFWSLMESRFAWASLYFLLAGLVRIYFVITHPYFDNIFSVRGVPYSDGQHWTTAAIEFARGNGLGNVYRPGFSVLLALFYVWTGWSFSLISGLNVVIGALSVVLIYLIGEAALNRWIGSAAALFFAFDPSQLSQTPQAVTEPLGLLFFLLSVYFILKSFGARGVLFVSLAGLFLAWSNLTRPLTIFCAPFYAIYLFAEYWLDTKHFWKALRIPAAFCLWLLLALSPWLLRQRVVNGVWAISTNVGEALYGVTSPKYKVWTPLVRSDADQANIPNTPGARYKYFMKKSGEQMHQYPQYYLKRVGKAYVDYLSSFGYQARKTSDLFRLRFQALTNLVEGQVLFLCVATALMILAAAWVWITSGNLAALVHLLVSAAGVTLLTVLPPSCGIIILAGGVWVTLARSRRQPAIVLIVSLVLTGIGNAIFGNEILYRGVLLTDWLFSLFYLAALFYAVVGLTSVVLRRPVLAGCEREDNEVRCPSVATFERRIKIGLVVSGTTVCVAVILSSVRIACATLKATPSVATQVGLSSADKLEVRTKVRQRARGEAKAALSDNARSWVISDAVVPYYVYDFPKGTEFDIRDPLFRKRPYLVSIFRTSRFDVIFPGRIPEAFVGKRVVIVGSVDSTRVVGRNQRIAMNCIAIVPYVTNTQPILSWDHSLIAQVNPISSP
jgi:hypothetical protein